MIGGNLVLLLPFFVSLFCYYFVEYMLQVARCFVVATRAQQLNEAESGG